MTPHRWIRRRGNPLDDVTDLFVAGIRVGRLYRTTATHWFATAFDTALDSFESKAAAKRALLRAVREPRVKQRAEAPKPVPANGWSGAYYRVDGEDRGWAVRMTGSNDVEARVYLSHNPTAWISATFCPGPGCSDAEAEARAWVEWRAGRKA